MNKLKILPPYPKIPHLPWEKTSRERGFTVTNEEAAIIFAPQSRVEVTEKVDGANCAIVQYNGHPIIRNRTAFLNKGTIKNSPAKKQFAGIFNWYYENERLFNTLKKLAGNVAVYGEWMVAQHGLFYDRLPTWFIAYELYAYEQEKSIDPETARKYLIESGFSVVEQLHSSPKDGVLSTYDQIEQLILNTSKFSTDRIREGLVLKVSDGDFIIDRFKMVRKDFIQGSLWDENKLKKNKLRGSQ